MAKFWAVLLALALNSNLIYIFTKAEDYECFQYPTYLMFLFGVFALVWDFCIYPESFRKLYAALEFLIEFLIATFLMEFILIEFLMPLEKAFTEFIPSIAEGIEYLMSTAKQEIGFVNDICDLLKSEDATVVASYALGVVFLVSMSQATRLIDLRILKCEGARAFVSDATNRTKRFYEELFGSSCRRNRCRRHNCCTTGHPEPSRALDNDDNDEDNNGDRRFKNILRCIFPGSRKLST